MKIALERERRELYERIDRRVAVMVEEGLLDEVRRLLAMGVHEGLAPMQSLGYRHMVRYLKGDWDWQRTLDLLARDTRRYAKRQLTWFRHAGRGFDWFHPSDYERISALVGEFLRSC